MAPAITLCLPNTCVSPDDTITAGHVRDGMRDRGPTHLRLPDKGQVRGLGGEAVVRQAPVLALLCHIHTCTCWHAHGSRVCRLDGDESTVDFALTGKSFHGGLEKFKKGFNYQRLAANQCDGCGQPFVAERQCTGARIATRAGSLCTKHASDVGVRVRARWVCVHRASCVCVPSVPCGARMEVHAMVPCTARLIQRP